MILIPISLEYIRKAEWQSGYAADCNSVNIGSIPFSASMPEVKLSYNLIE